MVVSGTERDREKVTALLSAVVLLGVKAPPAAAARASEKEPPSTPTRRSAAEQCARRCWLRTSDSVSVRVESGN